MNDSMIHEQVNNFTNQTSLPRKNRVSIQRFSDEAAQQCCLGEVS